MDPEWLRWAVGTTVGTAVGITGLRIAWLQYRVAAGQPLRTDMMVRDIEAPNVAEGALLHLSVRPALQPTPGILRSLWYAVAIHRMIDGTPRFLDLTWNEPSPVLDIRDGDTVWFRCAYTNVGRRVAHNVTISLPEFPFLASVRGQLTTFRHADPPSVLFTGADGEFRKVKIQRHRVQSAVVRDVTRGAVLQHLNQYEQAVMDCIGTFGRRRGEWRVRPVRRKLARGVCEAPIPLWQHDDDHYQFIPD